MRNKEEAISELLRERNVRERCYDRWVTEGRLTAVDAKDRLDRLIAALHYLGHSSTPSSQQSEKPIS